jgi:hypothetical protein
MPFGTEIGEPLLAISGHDGQRKMRRHRERAVDALGRVIAMLLRN